MLSRENIEDLSEAFPTVGSDGDGLIHAVDIQAALKVVGIDLPGYQIRELLTRYEGAHTLTVEQFDELYTELVGKRDAEINVWKRRISSATNTYQVQSGAVGADEVVHTVRLDEEVAFANWINSNLSTDLDLKFYLPVEPNGNELYVKIQDGIIFCKLVNLAVPETIDERAMNKKNLNTYSKLENLTLALMSAQSIGCSIVNIDADDLSKGKPHLVLGLLWQIIRIGLFSQIDLRHVPGLFRLLRPDETLDDLRKMSPEEILMRWVNYHLEHAKVERRLTNFQSDITDSFIYTHLLDQIAPMGYNVCTDILHIPDKSARAAAMLSEADKIGCRAFVMPNDVVNGNYKLNLAFVANLFNKHPNLADPEDNEMTGEVEVYEETHEEFIYRNWMNSLGVEPFVNWLYSDLSNGLIYFQIYDAIRPGIVTWKRVVKQSRKLTGMMDHIQNCNYVVELGKRMGFSLVGIQGKDLYDGNRTLTLALVWQLMRAYTLTVLAQCTDSGDRLATDKEIITWSNEKLKSAGKQTSIKSFQDSNIQDAKVVLDLVDAIKPGTIDYDLFSANDYLENAKYAITSGRKIGAKIYALPEDIVNVRPKMVMTVFACLMARASMSASQISE
ncbi:hypothetical protein L596_006250 [Steinernema carpocapsae]|uniref:Calponin-homology (CH) domain-containing protein n=1 Tax=Steinernema carpocapsae TaxID=34508 RepID=A0A4U8V1H9_STECR|nr:hypothetical protein L596_006250 [Steinernema carpocapsae]